MTTLLILTLLLIMLGTLLVASEQRLRGLLCVGVANVAWIVVDLANGRPEGALLQAACGTFTLGIVSLMDPLPAHRERDSSARSPPTPPDTAPR